MSAQIIAFPGTVAQFESVAASASTSIFDQPIPYELEASALERALQGLRAAVRAGDLESYREWRDELECMNMHSDRAEIRMQCLQALKRA